ncbi:SIMPL domain-containing protein [Hyphomicrobium methylovorum]|uniref:SIMPL domain-containing protein n=1 Tax=Hyphomicrobium methylovorum TaxID=84 RepID=UPI0015E68BB3|nr:SIMPL domain-containing protein [Hyphomicrobium methylovorum]MBA2124838.1 SIMPL domain-containing protein [Hyphomicrobium methylovorum]
MLAPQRSTFDTAILAGVAAAVMMAIAPVSAAHAEEKKMERTITVSATGTAEAEPDRARITSGVVIEAPTAREALSQNTQAMTKVVAQLKEKGIEAKDIQTASFNVEPVMDYHKDGQAPKLRGYRVSNQVVVLVRDLANAGAVLDQMVTSGANQIQGFAFEVSKAETLKDEARKEAVANALRRAKLLAAAAGAEVGDVIQISEEVSSEGPAPYVTARFAKAQSAPAAPIERGTATLEARVTATWALK